MLKDTDDKIREEVFNQIESYLSGAMDADSRAHFEQTMAQNEELRQQVFLHRLTIAAVRHHSHHKNQNLRQALNKLTDDELKDLLLRHRSETENEVACGVVNANKSVAASPIPAASAAPAGKKRSAEHCGSI